MKRSDLKHGDAETTEPRRVFGPLTTGKNLDFTQEDDLKSQTRLKRHVFMCVNINFSRLKQLHTYIHTRARGFYTSNVFSRRPEPPAKPSHTFLFNHTFSFNLLSS